MGGPGGAEEEQGRLSRELPGGGESRSGRGSGYLSAAARLPRSSGASRKAPVCAGRRGAQGRAGEVKRPEGGAQEKERVLLQGTGEPRKVAPGILLPGWRTGEVPGARRE